MLHGARSLAVPTYHIRPMGETASFHDGKQRATRPSVSRVSSSDGTAGWRSLAAQARPVRAYHTTIHPIGACLRCKKATNVAELTHPCRHRHRGNRPFLDQVFISFPGAGLSLAMRQCHAATGWLMTAPLDRFPNGLWSDSLSRAAPRDGSSNSSRPQAESPGTRLPAAWSRGDQGLRAPIPRPAP